MSEVSRELERWLPVPGYEGFYEVSNLGKVRSLPRVIEKSNGARMTLRGQMLKPYDSGDGHVRVRLQKVGHIVDRYVHQLVLETFVGPPPPDTEGCHWDGNPQNNRVDNLRWDTRSENIRDNVRLGRHGMSSRTHCPRGHELTAPNLVPSDVLLGRRACLACARANSNKRRANERGDMSCLVSRAGRSARIVHEATRL